ncbi:TPA: hypothetical protein I6875_001030 [Vibrio cholerae]|nr:hypothetical protein [Vibrio cholerae]HAS4574289.1 hypothetical protein [Vibrio cholerae]
MEQFPEIKKRINELKHYSKEDLIFYIKIINYQFEDKVINDRDNLHLKDSKQIAYIFYDSLSQLTEIPRVRFDNFLFDDYEALHIEETLNKIVKLRNHSRDLNGTLLKIKHNQRAILFLLTNLRFHIRDNLEHISISSIRTNFLKSEYEHLKRQNTRFGPKNREMVFLENINSTAEFEECLYLEIYDILETYMINNKIKSCNILEVIDDILFIHEKAERNIKTSWELIKTQDENLQDWLIEKFERRYYIVRNQSPKNKNQKSELITLYLEMMFSSLDKEEFEVRIKALKDEFSRKKILKYGSCTIEIDSKHLKKLTELAGGDSKGKIKKQIHKLIDEAYTKKI